MRAVLHVPCFLNDFRCSVQELKSEGERKAEEIERLRAAEKFMKKGTGEGECQACGYTYSPKDGDDEYPIPKGTAFEVRLCHPPFSLLSSPRGPSPSPSYLTWPALPRTSA